MLTSFFTTLPKLTHCESPETASSTAQPALLLSMLDPPTPIAGPSTAIGGLIHDEDLYKLDLQPVDSEHMSAFGEVPGIGSDLDTYLEAHELPTTAPEVSLGVNMITQLQVATSRLPNMIPLATSTDELARFSGDLEEASGICDDPWEMIDQSLNAVLGYGRTTADIMGLVRRGPNGMDGLCNWLSVCITKLNIDLALLEGKVQRLLDAMALL